MDELERLEDPADKAGTTPWLRIAVIVMAVAVSVLAVGVVVSSVGDDDTDRSSVTTSVQADTAGPSTVTEPPSSTVATSVAPAETTVGQLVDGVEQDIPAVEVEGTTAEVEILCDEDDATIVGRGTVLYCGAAYEPPVPLEVGTYLIVVTDDAGTFAYNAATDMVDLHSVHGPGLFCRDLLALPYLDGLVSATSYLHVLAYWFQDGEPDRMDADGNAVPCETLFDPASVASVWNGGRVGL